MAIRQRKSDLISRLARLRTYNRLRRLVTGWNKADLINRIAELRSYRSYLEICNARSGYRYGEIDRAILPRCHRLVYRCPVGHFDGEPIDFSTEGIDTAECFREIRSRHASYDIVLVDPWHEYATTQRDLADALSVLTEDGTVVVHDCLPPREDLTKMPFIGGEWCGVTYRAFLDFVVKRSLEYRTVDIDFGCGIIRKRSDASAPSSERMTLLQAWDALGDDDPKAFQFMRRHPALWNVVELQDFVRGETRDALRSRIGAREESIAGWA
jgi:hypothetical protein